MTELPNPMMPFTIHGVSNREPETEIVVTRVGWCWWEAEAPYPEHGYFGHTSGWFTARGALRRARRWHRRRLRQQGWQADARRFDP